MSNPHRDLIEALVTAIESDVDEASDWTIWRHRPRLHPTDAAYLALWWEFETPDEAFHTTGSMDLVSSYRIRYWEPSPEDASGHVADEDAEEAVEALYMAVRDVVFDNQELGTTDGDTYQLWFAGGQPSLELAENAVRGFELSFTARTRGAFS